MRTVKLHFTDGNHLTTLLADKNFQININYLSPSDDFPGCSGHQNF